MILYVAAKIDREAAERALSKRRFFTRSAYQPKKIELIYLPHYIFAIKIASPKFAIEQVALDALEGEFSYYFEQPTQSQPDQPSEIFPFSLSLPIAEKKALESLKRALLQASLKRGTPFRIEKIVERKKLYLPFWVGYFQRKNHINIAVVDALEGRPQGAKIKQIFMKAFIRTG